MSASSSSIPTPLEGDGVRVRYARRSSFHGELRRRVTAYFRATSLPVRGLRAMYAKTAVIAVWAAGSARLNRVMAFGLDLLGGSSYLWHWKHNVFHHGYPNVVGMDEDLDVGPLARLAPAQRRRFAHRFQHVYMWILYGCVANRRRCAGASRA